MAKILIIEDEKSILLSLQDDLEMEGYQVTAVNNGKQGLEEGKRGVYDLIILDIMLPDTSGFDVCKQLRSSDIFTPILILSVKKQDIDKVLGLELGADDYVTKPFNRLELLARVRALLRRTQKAEQPMDHFSFNDVTIDFKKFEVRKKDKPVHLTSTEFALLHLFVTHQDEVLSRDKILDEVWGEDAYITHRNVDTHIAHLRNKLEDNPSNPKNIVGVRGIGYIFVVE